MLKRVKEEAATATNMSRALAANTLHQKTGPGREGCREGRAHGRVALIGSEAADASPGPSPGGVAKQKQHLETKRKHQHEWQQTAPLCRNTQHNEHRKHEHGEPGK